MKKLNFNYILTDQQGRVLKNGHIKYSISHFIYALYQKNYTTSPASMFWRSFNNALNNIGLVAFAFVNHTPQALNSSSRVGIIKLLHAFGYFAFYDITGTYPIFRRIKERVWLVDYQFNRAMSFHVKTPSKKSQQITTISIWLLLVTQIILSTKTERLR